MTIGFSTALRNSRLDAIKNVIDGGAGAGTLKIYTAPRPATGGAVGAATLLGTLTFSDPSAPAASGGVLTFSAITADGSADASGTAAWARIEDSTGAFVMDLSVGLAGSGAEVTLVDTNIVITQTISIDAASITEAGA